MIGLMRNIIIVFAILTVVYVTLGVWNRWRERSRLRNEYRAETQAYSSTDSEDEFIARGMAAYSRSLRSKLILGVYAIPGAIATLLIWLAQYS
jgi:FtsZ-interacting cell division protein ZipA